MKICLFLIIICLFIASCDVIMFAALDDNLPQTEESLSIANPDGSHYQKLLKDFIENPKFSYDDESIITISGYDFKKVNIAYPYASIILEFDNVYERHFSVSPVDNSFVFSDGNDSYLYNHDSSVLVNLTENLQEGAYRYPSFSPDGSEIILVASTYSDSLVVRNISSLDLSNSSINNLFEVEGYWNKYPLYSDDMTKVFYISHYNICMRDVDGSNYQVIKSDVYDARFSTGSNYVVFSESSRIYTFNFITNQLVDLIEGNDPVIAKDGSKILFENYDSDRDHHLYKINIDGTDKEKHKRINENYYTFSWSGDKITYIRYKETYD